MPTKLHPVDLLNILNSAKEKVKNSKAIQKAFKEYDVALDEIDTIPMCFKELDVSARTEHGCIFFNYSLLNDGTFEDDEHYMAHEITHWLQQTCRSKATPAFTDDTYLDDPSEKEGFQTQVEYINDEHGSAAADNYLEKLLDYHDVDGKERDKKKQELSERTAQFIALVQKL